MHILYVMKGINVIKEYILTFSTVLTLIQKQIHLQ